jgi:hypothetical protein
MRIGVALVVGLVCVVCCLAGELSLRDIFECLKPVKVCFLAGGKFGKFEGKRQKSLGKPQKFLSFKSFREIEKN